MKTLFKKGLAIWTMSFALACGGESGKPGAGIPNQGNTCFFNAIMQCMLAPKGFIEKIANHEYTP